MNRRAVRFLPLVALLLLGAAPTAAQADVGVRPLANQPDTNRKNPGTIRLNDGKILVVGGYDNNGTALSTYDLYNPTTGTWAGAKEAGRARGTAYGDHMFLFDLGAGQDHKILVVGDEPYPSSQSSQVYDPSTDTWSDPVELDSAHGGAPYAPICAQNGNGYVGCFGYFPNYPTYGGSYAIALYSPGNDDWAMQSPSAYGPGVNTVFAGLPGDQFLQAGTSSPPSNAAQVYDVSDQAWVPTGDMVMGMREAGKSIRLNDGRVLVVGGRGDPTPLDGADWMNNTLDSGSELFDPATGTWTSAGSPSAGSALTNDSAIALNSQGKVVYGLPNGPYAVTFDPTTNTWDSGNAITSNYSSIGERSSLALAADDTVFWIGGGGGNWTQSSYIGEEVDTTPPDAPLLDGVPSSPTSANSATISFTGEDGATFQCSVDGAAYTACSSPLSLSGLSIGDHSVLVTQTDAAGNVSTAANATWTVESAASNAPRLIAKVGLTRNPRTKVTTLTLRASSDRSQGANPVTKLEYWNHGVRPKDSAAPRAGFIRAYAPVVVLRPGQVAFWVRVKDSKGKWSGWYRTRFKPGGLGW